MLEFCVWEGKGTNLSDKIKPMQKNIGGRLLDAVAEYPELSIRARNEQ